jgi:plastocyanin
LRRRRIAWLAAGVIVSACTTAEPPPADTQAATTTTTIPAPASGAGRVVGQVNASGTAVVVLAPKDQRTFAPQDEKPVMDQANLTFTPELMFVRTGQPAEFRNSDDVLHNVNVKHEDTREQAFNVAIPTGGNYDYTFGREGFYRVGCDIHPAMAASIFASATPFTTLAGSDGSFVFDDVPPGPWIVTVYTGGRRLQKDVAVKGGVSEITVE